MPSSWEALKDRAKKDPLAALALTLVALAAAGEIIRSKFGSGSLAFETVAAAIAGVVVLMVIRGAKKDRIPTWLRQGLIVAILLFVLGFVVMSVYGSLARSPEEPTVAQLKEHDLLATFEKYASGTLEFVDKQALARADKGGAKAGAEPFRLGNEGSLRSKALKHINWCFAETFKYYREELTALIEKPAFAEASTDFRYELKHMGILTKLGQRLDGRKHEPSTPMQEMIRAGFVAKMTNDESLSVLEERIDTAESSGRRLGFRNLGKLDLLFDDWGLALISGRVRAVTDALAFLKTLDAE